MKPVPHGEPYAGKLHVRFDEGAGVPDNKGRPALLYTLLSCGKDGARILWASVSSFAWTMRGLMAEGRRQRRRTAYIRFAKNVMKGW